jgi:phage N-6-adenine-methyltransferase
MRPSSLQVLTSTTGNRHDCWNTPKEIVNDVLLFFNHNLELDPCSNSEDTPNVPAKKVYTEETNGIAHNWIADSVFMNHPYSESKLWIPYAVQQYECGNAKELILLIKLDVSTKWWKSVSKYPWVAVNKRLKFGESKSASPFQSAIVYLGKDLGAFVSIFGKYGPTYITYDNTTTF